MAGGSGMGSDAAKKLATNGYRVSILSSSGKGEALAKKLKGIGITGSNQSNKDIKNLINKTFNKWGRIDMLLNSAAHGPKGPVLKLSDFLFLSFFKSLAVVFSNKIGKISLATLAH